MTSLKEAMKAKDKVALETLRAVKSEIMKMETASNAVTEISKSDEIKLLQKMQKQRKDAATIYKSQGRDDLESHELDQCKVLNQFLPQQMSQEELSSSVLKIIKKIGATSSSDMGKVMGVCSKELAGKAEGRLIADIVKSLLNSL